MEFTRDSWIKKILKFLVLIVLNQAVMIFMNFLILDSPIGAYIGSVAILGNGGLTALLLSLVGLFAVPLLTIAVSVLLVSRWIKELDKEKLVIRIIAFTLAILVWTLGYFTLGK